MIMYTYESLLEALLIDRGKGGPAGRLHQMPELVREPDLRPPYIRINSTNRTAAIQYIVAIDSRLSYRSQDRVSVGHHNGGGGDGGGQGGRGHC